MIDELSKLEKIRQGELLAARQDHLQDLVKVQEALNGAHDQIRTLHNQRDRILAVLQDYIRRGKDPLYPPVAKVAVVAMIEDLLKALGA